MNLKTFAKAVRRSAGKNASKILGGLAITGSITAVYFAVTATPKAMILLDEKKQELGVEKLDVKTIVKTAGPVYVPTALSMVLSAGCVIGAVHVDERRNAALAAACTLSESALKTYQDKVLEAIGPEKEPGDHCTGKDGQVPRTGNHPACQEPCRDRCFLRPAGEVLGKPDQHLLLDDQGHDRKGRQWGQQTAAQ